MLCATRRCSSIICVSKMLPRTAAHPSSICISAPLRARQVAIIIYLSSSRIDAIRAASSDSTTSIASRISASGTYPIRHSFWYSLQRSSYSRCFSLRSLAIMLSTFLRQPQAPQQSPLSVQRHIPVAHVRSSAQPPANSLWPVIAAIASYLPSAGIFVCSGRLSPYHPHIALFCYQVGNLYSKRLRQL